MLEWWHKIRRGPWRNIAYTVGLPLLAALCVGGMMSALGCEFMISDNDGSDGTRTTRGTGGSYVAVMEHGEGENGVFQPGHPGRRVLQGAGTLVGRAEYAWSPPDGVTQITFNTPPEPGGPPYVWKNLMEGALIIIDFAYPETPPPDCPNGVLVDAFEVNYGDGQTSVVATYSQVDFGQNSAPQSARVPARRLSAAPANETTFWHIQQWIDPHDQTLTTETCQQFNERNENGFIALRLPVTQETITQAVKLPVVYDGTHIGGPTQNQLTLMNYVTYGPIASVPLAYELDRLALLANVLPPQAGERWVALGLSQLDSGVCPEGLDLAAGDWGYVVDLWLDLSHLPNNGQGCELPAYLCYEGLDPPATFTEAGLHSYQGHGITCVGPLITQLLDNPSWRLDGTASRTVQAGKPVWLPHSLFAQSEHQVTLSISSTLEADWMLYAGSREAPDLNMPITGPVSFDSRTYFWAHCDPVPPDAPDGPCLVNVRAALVGDPTEQQVVTDRLWVGESVAPPSKGTTVHLPFLSKHQ